MCGALVVDLEHGFEPGPARMEQGPMENAPPPGPNLKFFTTHTGAPMVYTLPHVIVKEKDSSQW